MWCTCVILQMRNQRSREVGMSKDTWHWDYYPCLLSTSLMLFVVIWGGRGNSFHLEEYNVQAKEFSEIWQTFYCWVWLLVVSDVRTNCKALNPPEHRVPCWIRSRCSESIGVNGWPGSSWSSCDSSRKWLWCYSANRVSCPPLETTAATLAARVRMVALEGPSWATLA